MYKVLDNYICKKINEYEIQIKEVSKKANEFKEVYDLLKPKGRKFKKENVVKLSNDKKLLELVFNKFKSNMLVMENLLKHKVMYENYVKQVDSMLFKAGLSRDFIYNESFLNSIKLKGNDRVYNELCEMKKREEELFKLNEKIVLYTCEVIIDTYESFIEEKEEYKDEKKSLEKAIYNIRRNRDLTSCDILCINKMINEEDNKEIKEKLSCIFNKYLQEHTKKEEIKEEKIKKEEVEKRATIVYVDNEIVKEKKKEDPIILNYLNSLRTLSNSKEIDILLDSIITNSNKVIINKIIKLLTNSKEDIILKEYLLNYLNKFNEVKEKDNQEEIVILYNGFLNKKNIILDDINSLPKEYYHDIRKAINIIKENGALNKRENIVKVKKVFKLRVHDIRVAFKRLSNNVYIILGVYVKKEGWGNKIVESIKKRNEDFLMDEKSIVNAINVDEIWGNLLDSNESIEKEINAFISSKVKKI